MGDGGCEKFIAFILPLDGGGKVGVKKSLCMSGFSRDVNLY